MGITNQGSQTITFDFKLPAKGSTFNKLNRNVLQPGIYSGLKITYVGNNVFISTGSVVLNCKYNFVDNLQVKINFDSTYNYGVVNPTTISENEILYLEYEYGEVIENYADFKHTSSGSFDFNNKNLIIIGELIYNISNNISSVSYTNRTFGFMSSDLNYSIPDNKKFYNIIDESKFFYFNGSNLPTGTRKINIPIFSESEGDILITNSTNTSIVKNNLLVSGTSNLNIVNIFSNLNVSGQSTFKQSIISESSISSSGNINSYGQVSILNDTESTNKGNGSLVTSGGIGITKNLNVGGDTNIDNFLNINKSTNLSGLNITSNTSITADFTNTDVVFITLNNASATTITLSIPALSVNKVRELKLFVRSNGNYTFASSTTQGNIIYWRTTSNSVGVQPTWSQFNNITDAHAFTFDSSKVYHIETYSYVVSITAPSNLNYVSNSFEFYVYLNQSIPVPTLNGTAPFSFSNSPSISGLTINPNSGSFSIYATSGSNNTNTTVTATNSSGNTTRQISVRYSNSIGTFYKGNYSYDAGFGLAFFVGYANINFNNIFQPILSFGSISNTSFYSNYGYSYISALYASSYIVQSLTLSIVGNITGSTLFNTLEIGGYTFLRSDSINPSGDYNGSSSPPSTNFSWLTVNAYDLLNALGSTFSFRIY